ncbi:NACHT, LRR and PYD domains-containing protein 1a [Channa argus]|uniref:NACHT, LRR and PYD domains-containing protein 1a n=1 Tax=Channa argus TaxID=215402 RepID=A0A6G1QMP5_CHAAH|nr:NACHT, LRR and PYD domains-containing protein 1a [Channa argus]
MKTPRSFSPELQTESTQVSYRFSCPGAGEFQCLSTGLMFGMTQEAELQYRTVQWDENLLQTAGKMPAGPLFDIKCSDDAVCQLQLPHCETEDALLSDGLLSVIHISEDRLSFLEPLQITGTHVVVEVPHLSVFGLVRDLIKRKSFRSQVLLFLQKPNTKAQKHLNVFLLPYNIPLEEVRAQHPYSEYIQVPSTCWLITGQTYSVDCSEADMIQPEREMFDPQFGPNLHPMFEIHLPTDTDKVTIRVRDERMTEVWKRVAYLTVTSGFVLMINQNKILKVLCSDGLLSVVHITYDGTSFLETLDITETHVVVKVPHLSAFGLVWDNMERFLNIKRLIQGQVLLFLRHLAKELRILDLFLLQENITLKENLDQEMGVSQ